MAKNIFTKRKRVAHCTSLNEDCGEMQQMDIDYVSNIIKEMDTNFHYVKNNSLTLNHSERKASSKTEQKMNEKDIPTPSSSKIFKNQANLKKFTINRKFPLMEKSQKVLKQLKHNQRIPKQRAHLSAVPSSPPTCSKAILSNKNKSMNGMTNKNRNLPVIKRTFNKSCENSSQGKSILRENGESSMKQNKISPNTILKSMHKKSNAVNMRAINKTANISCINNENLTASVKKSNEVRNYNNYFKKSHVEDNASSNSSIQNKINSASSRSNSNVSSRSNSSTSCRSNITVNYKNNSTLNEKNDSNFDDTTDDEFEKFVERNKKHLKKNKKLQKKTKAVRKSSKKPIRKPSDAETSDEEISHQKTKRIELNRKRIKAKTIPLGADVSSEDEQMDGDMCKRYSSSESEAAQLRKTSKKPVHKLSDAKTSDEEISPPKTKKIKVNHKRINAKTMALRSDVSEVEQMDGDMYTRYSSSESEAAPEDATCSSLSVQSKDNECDVSLSEQKGEKVKAISKVLSADESEAEKMDGAMYTRYSSSENVSAPVDTMCSPLSVQLKNNDCYVSLSEEEDVKINVRSKALVTEEIDLMNGNVKTEVLSSESENRAPVVISCGSVRSECYVSLSESNAKTDEDNMRHSLNSSQVLTTNSKQLKLRNPISECIELSSSEEEDDCLNSNISLNLATEKLNKVLGKSEKGTLSATTENAEVPDLKTVEIFSETVTAKDSEESDLEILDVILLKPKECSIAANDNNSATSIENHVHESDKKIKSEPSPKQMGSVQIKKEHVRNEVTSDGSHEAVYTTNICKGNNSDHNPKLLQPHSDVAEPDKFKYKSSEGSFCDQFTNPRIKKEKSDDDDVMIIDSAAKPVKIDLHEKQSSENTKISPTLNKIKSDWTSILFGGYPDIKMKNSVMQQMNFVPCLADEQKCENNALNEENAKFSQLIDLFKQEFQTYQELLEAETDLEVKLKIMETKQAEKLMKIRSIIQSVISSKQYEVAGNNSKMDEAIESLRFKNLNTIKFIHSNKTEDIHSRKLNIVDELALTSSPLLYAVRNADEKTEYSRFSNSQKLDFISPKLEPVSVEETRDSHMAMKLLGEKCVMCSKNAVAACERCAKVFFCSNECGKNSWHAGHKDECGKM